MSTNYLTTVSNISSLGYILIEVILQHQPRNVAHKALPIRALYNNMAIHPPICAIIKYKFLFQNPDEINLLQCTECVGMGNKCIIFL